MSWVKLDDQFSHHPKIMQAGPLAGWLHVCALCYCASYLTDGFVPNAVTNVLANFSYIGVTTAGNDLVQFGHDIEASELVDMLVFVGLWEEVENGYKIHDYLDYNPSKAEVLAERAKNAERQGRYQAKRQRNTVTNTANNGVSDASVTGVPYPLILSKDSTAQAQPRAPKPKPEPKPEREPSETWIIAEALADVCKMDLTANKGRLLKEAATLLKANPHPTAELLRQHYNGGGWWWANDWRGQRREFPQPATIRETWGKWGIEAPEVKPFAVEEWR